MGNRRIVPRYLSAAIAATGALMATVASASGYLTPLAQGITVNGYMMNNSTGGAASTGMTIWVSGISNPDSCGGTDKVFIPSSVANYSALVAAVISAFTAGQHIGFWSSGCDLMPFWGGTTTYPYVVTLWAVP
jgi:hypothetical protein